MTTQSTAAAGRSRPKRDTHPKRSIRPGGVGVGLSALATAVAMALGGNASAQQQQQGDRVLEEVTVTGSRIMRTSGFSTAVPVTAVTLEELDTLLPGTTLTDQLDVLPQFFLTQSPQRGGGALFGSAGRAAVNLRALGSARTLVLLDGARISPADRDGSVHTDNIPTALLRQVEVVTGGASAAYGADALAGVVNFILDREFTGVDLDVGFGNTDDGYGDNRDVSLAFGTELGDRWHFIGSVEMQEIDQIDQPVTELGSWFRRVGHVENPAWSPGNTSVPRRLTLDNVHSTRHTPTGRIRDADDASGAAVPFSLAGLQFTLDGQGLKQFVPGDVVGAGTVNQSGGPEARIANLAFTGEPFGAEVKRRNVFTGLTFDLDDSTRFWVNLMAGESESNQIARRGIPHGTTPWNFNIFQTNPFLPDSIRDTMIAEGVDAFRLERQGQILGLDGQWNDKEDDFNEYSGWTLQLGLDKQLGDNWNMQVRVQRGATDHISQIPNELRVDREFLAIDAVEVYADMRDLTDDAGTGGPDGLPDLTARTDWGTGITLCNVQRYNPTPAQLLDSVNGDPNAVPPIPPFLVPAPQGDASLGGPTDRVPIPGPIGPDNTVRDCVPLNVLGQGNASSEAAAYVISPKARHGAVTQEFAELLFTGDIADGIGAGPFGAAFGATWREQHFWQFGAPVELMAYGPPRNDPSLGIRGISGGFTGGSPNLHQFSTVPVIDGGYDVWEVFTEFNFPLWESSSGNQRLEIDVAGRYSEYSTSGGINSNKVGLNLQLAESLRFRATSSRDVREPTFAERFNRQGGGGSVRDPSPPAPANPGDLFEITTTSGGNPNLAPEEADTVTAGFVLQPAGAPGFQFSMDWFEIDVDGLVGQLSQQEIVDNCFATGDPTVCSLVRRDQGLITNVDRLFLNIDSAKVRGIDYELVYRAEPNLFSSQAENLSFRLLAGRLLEDSTVSSGSFDDNAGLRTEPHLTGVASVRYQIGDFGFNLQQRFIPETAYNNEWTEGVDVDDNTIEGQSTTDLTLFYQGETAGGSGWQASLSVTNLFDRDPPVVPGFGQRGSAQTGTPDNFDVFGRRYMMNFRMSF